MFTEVSRNHNAEIKRLQDRVCELEDRLEMYQQELGLKQLTPLVFGFTKNEEKIFNVMMKKEVAYTSFFLTAMYTAEGKNEAEPNIVKVHVHRMRAKLKPFKIKIHVLYGRGYYLTPEDKERARAFYGRDEEHA